MPKNYLRKEKNYKIFKPKKKNESTTIWLILKDISINNIQNNINLDIIVYFWLNNMEYILDPFIIISE